MIAIITGDIIKSKKAAPAIWLPILKKVLSKYGKESEKWEIFRGDSFQLETNIADVFHAYLYIRTAIKTIPPLDVRMSIGVGEKDYKGESILNSNGSAFINSGEAFEELKKQTVVVKTPWNKENELFDILLSSAAFIIEKWNPNTSSTILIALENPDITQKKLAEKMGKDAGLLSRQLKKAGFEEIQKTIDYCTKTLLAQC